MTSRLQQGVAKVVFQNRTFKNNNNYIWIRVSRSYLGTLARYWQNKDGFYYMKIYEFNRKTRVVGLQWGWITRTSFSNYCKPNDSRFSN